MEKGQKIFVAGHRGLVGSALIRKLEALGYHDRLTRSHTELDLTIQADVDRFFEVEQPNYVFAAAAKVGGIYANHTYPAEFIYQNLMIASNIIHAAFKYGVKKLLFLGSSCIYPKASPQPIKEEYLLSGPLETTNEAYAIAKIAGLKMCQYFNRQYKTKFITVMPCNLYGPCDNFNPETSHVLAGLLQRFHLAKMTYQPEVIIWGTGRPRREFLHVDDLADACVFLMNHDCDGDVYNAGAGWDITILELANLIKEVVGYQGRIVFDPSKPDGTYQKLLEVSRLTKLGWQSRINLREGIAATYDWYLANESQLRR
ncbi:MAG TPA: GDP-L-fucose synthase [Bacillota bacterium]|nr:GDP-L-fucose synthase [Bacillota bacterium]